MDTARFRRYSLLVLGVTLAVILWGAYVRASGSGAGCGSHWPTCNGEVIPRPRSVATIIELTHRLTSGVSFLLVVGLLIGALRRFPRRHPVRWAASAAMLFMVTEALVGAGLVLLELVAKNQSLARGIWIAAHLVNTFALIAALALTAWFSDGERAGEASREAAPVAARRLGALLALGLGATLLVAVSGSIAALGDTLFPARSLAAGLAEDLSPTSHLFLRLRLWHPVLAVLAGLYLVGLGTLVARRAPSPEMRQLGTTLGTLVLVQLFLGVVNLVLLAPTTLQILHLLLGDLVWIALVLLTAAVLTRARARVPEMNRGAR